MIFTNDLQIKIDCVFNYKPVQYIHISIIFIYKNKRTRTRYSANAYNIFDCKLTDFKNVFKNEQYIINFKKEVIEHENLINKKIIDYFKNSNHMLYIGL